VKRKAPTSNFKRNYVFLAFGKRVYSKFLCLNFKAISLCYNLVFNGDSLDAVLCPSSFCKGNIFRKLFRNEVVRRGRNFSRGWLIDIKPFTYNSIQ